MDDDGPSNIFVIVGKGGSELYADGDALARSIKLGLDAGVKIEDYVTALKGISHQNTNRLTYQASSMADAVARTLEELYLAPSV